MADNRMQIIKVKNKREFIEHLNAAKPSDKFFEDCKKAARIFERLDSDHRPKM